MSDASEPSTIAATPGRSALRLVLFGMPHAGKSSLLGALAQTAQTHEPLLHGQLTDLSQGLAELQRRLYEDQPRETLEEIVAYPVTFEPLGPQGPASKVKPMEAVLIDCDGRVANDLLSRRHLLNADGSKGGLAGAILAADALILAIDASDSPGQVAADFKEFGRFLKLLEHHRGQHSEVGGLPVFLVLTKCDLLSRPEDSSAAWMDRIEEHKLRVDSRFREFLSRQQVEGPLPFGRINLHLWATAVKRPALADAPARPREPYGVAELFRQAFENARGFQVRSARSTRRLVWTLSAGLGLIVGMLGLALFLLLHRTHEDPRVRELLRKVDSYSTREPTTPSNRLRGPLQSRISELTDLKNDPDFSLLPHEKRQYVTARLQELQDYRAYYDKLVSLAPLGDVRTEAELENYETSLTNLAVPVEHKSEWSQTEAALMRSQRLESITALRGAVAAEADKQRNLIRRGEDLWTFSQKKEGAPIGWADWNNQVQSFLEESEAAQRKPTERVPGTEFTLDTVLRFDKVVAPRMELEKIKQRLQRLRNLSIALGMGGPDPRRSPLDIPAIFTIDQASAREQDLKKTYPRFQEDFTLVDLPEAIINEIRQAARMRYDHALKAGREAVLRRLQDTLQGGAETYESWRRLRTWLENPAELQAWRVLAMVLARLQTADATDPVAALAAFLDQDHFDLTLGRLVLEIPDDRKIRPAGRLVIHHVKGDDAKPAERSFELLGDERHDAGQRVTRFSFKPQGGATLTYRPGENLWAEVSVKSGDSPDWVLTWTAARSQVYQFERLVQPPRLHRRDQPNLEGVMEEHIFLSFSPENGPPKVPDLLPVVPGK